MIVQPKLVYEFADQFEAAITGNEPKNPPERLRHVVGTPEGHGLIVQCEVVQPPSGKGRTAMLWIPEEAVDFMLKELRKVAIERRR